MQLPNFFIVGAAKAGTTALAQALGQHPQIFMCDPKEPNFFNNDAWERGDVSAEALSDYGDLFAGVSGEPVVGEASVGYLESSAAPGLIHRYCGDAKVLVVLRNPVERVRSLYEMYLRIGHSLDFEAATGRDPWLLRQCLYTRSVERYVRLFEEGRFLWVEHGDLQRSWGETLARIQEWLGVDVVGSAQPVVRNLGGAPQSRLGGIFFNRRLVNAAKRLLPRPVHGPLDRVIKPLLLRRFELTPQQIDRFRGFFADDVRELGKLLGADFGTRWFGCESSTSQACPDPR